MKRLFKGILVIMVLLAAGLFGLEAYRSTRSEKDISAPALKSHSTQASPFYNSSDARVPYGFPLAKRRPHGNNLKQY